MMKGWLVFHCPPGDLQERQIHTLLQQLRWTMAKHHTANRPALDVVAWQSCVTASRHNLDRLAEDLDSARLRAVTAAHVAEPSLQVFDLLREVRGEIVIDERIAGKDCQLHWDHPLASRLRELGFALWPRGYQSDEEPAEDLHEESEAFLDALREMRNVPRPSDEVLKPQHVAVHLPHGKSPGDYAEVAYSDVPDGSQCNNGLGGRHVLLFHSAMQCNCPPYDLHRSNNRDERLAQGRTVLEPREFVFLNAAAAGVRYVDEDSNGLVAHVRSGRIRVEAVGEPKHREREDHVQNRRHSDE
jgi:hypothetical protein